MENRSLAFKLTSQRIKDHRDHLSAFSKIVKEHWKLSAHYHTECGYKRMMMCMKQRGTKWQKKQKIVKLNGKFIIFNIKFKYKMTKNLKNDLNYKLYI